MKKLINAYENHTPHSVDYLTARRQETPRGFPTKKVLAYGAAVLASVGGYIGYNNLNATHPQMVTEVVQPYDVPWTIVHRAEKDAGVNLDGLTSGEMLPAVDRVVKEYGSILHAGQEIKVVIHK